MTTPITTTPMTAPTIGEIFQIPRQIHQGDFVLKLTEGVDEQHAAATLRDYIVTPQLVDAFRQSLGLVSGALDAGTSRGAYLHGSFGAGKSHFMAVLSLLLDNDTRARAVPELAPVVVENHAWLGKRKVLVVPMHLIGARSLEDAVLGQYALHIRQRHPDAPTPGFYRSERLFADATQLRTSMGDAPFFGRLNERAPEDGGWGALSGGWDAASFESALSAAAGDPERARLVGDLVDAFFTSAARLASTHDEGFLPIDEGLMVLTEHAKSLGYDAVVLFLDEVMLWLASNAANQNFLSLEAGKLSKLVEAAQMRRPIPIVSFLARQRDLRELVGEHIAGAEQNAITNVLSWWEGRFDVVRLEDRNLPAIIERRLLRPIDDGARARLEEAHAQTEGIRTEVMSVLLTREGDRDQFRRIYPFSPVLVQALVALSSLLQRERTALKLLVQLLVKQRDTLRLGDVMPVGELWSVLSDGTEQPFSAALRERFDQARKLWKNKLLPLLEEERAANIASGISAEVAALTLQNDGRLLATLILAALAEGIEALDQLTPQKLVALNHGTVRARIPGQEGRTVHEKLRRWAGRIGEIRFSDPGATSTVSLHLVGVDTEIILENARAADTGGARVQKVRSLLFQLADIPGDDAFVAPVRSVPWHGTQRLVEVLFRNVRGMAPEQFRPSAQAPWKLVIDYPFDEPGCSPADDRASVQAAQHAGEDALSIVWLPAFLTPAAQDELGKLVLLDHVLSGNQLDAHASHLSAQDRAQAKELLINQRSAVHANAVNALLAAYGITTQFRDKIDQASELDTPLYTLAPGLTLQRPVGAAFRDCLDQLVGQALAWQYPAHPAFETEVRPAALKKVWQWVQRAAQQNGRAEVDRPDREDMRRLAVPLNLGQMGDAHFVLERQWESHFAQRQAQDGVTPLTVQRVRAWIDQPRPRGLTREAQSLVILTWALQTDRSFHLYGGMTPVEGKVESLSDELEIRAQKLPDEAQWQKAVKRTNELFGITPPSQRSAQALVMLARQVDESRQKVQQGVMQYTHLLEAGLPRAGIELGASERFATAKHANDLLTALEGVPAEGAVQALAAARVTTPTAMGETISRGVMLARTVASVQWTLVTGISGLPRESFGTRADVLLETLREALRRDEHVISLEPAVVRFNDDGMRLLTEAAQLARRSDTEAQRLIEEEKARQAAIARAQEEQRRELERREAALAELERARLQREQEEHARLEREQEERARVEREREERERQERNRVIAGGMPKTKRVFGANIDTVLAELKHDVASSGDAEFEVSWSILPKGT